MAVRRSAFLMLLVSLLLTLGVGAMAHATESLAQHDVEKVAWHWEGDGDHSPPDQDSPVPHHHGGCHGHHIGTPTLLPVVAGIGALALAGEAEVMTALRPVERQPEIDPPIF
ncbi:hypothetical protein [Novosphingobium resinovorum]|uniref:hypothetical protein n=1 Tax=Novosphingobium resinovorum TaxID=158500 RepID=UPI002ED4AB76|nr:hypothetical protein [Novosphingobium resinovorum]